MEKTVKDIMVPVEKYPTISVTSSVKEAAAVLCKALETGSHHVNSSLIVMENNTLAGMLGLREVLKAIDPVIFKEGTYRGWTVSEDWKQPLFLRGLFTEKYREVSEHSIADIMRPATQTLSLNDTLLKALHILVSNGFEAIPVLQDARVVGMVGILEIMREVTKAQDSTQGADARVQQAAV